MELWMEEEDQKRRSRCSQKKQGWFKITGFTTGFLYQNFWLASQREKRTIKKNTILGQNWRKSCILVEISIWSMLILYADLEDKAVTS